MATLNAHLAERFRGRHPRHNHDQASGGAPKPPVQVDPAIRTYMRVSAQISSGPQSDWLSLPELPTAAEILPDKETIQQQDVERLLRAPVQVM